MHEPKKLERLTRQEPAWLWPACPRYETAIDRVDVKRDVDRVSVLPGQFQHDFGGLFKAKRFNVGDGQDVGVALAAYKTIAPTQN